MIRVHKLGAPAKLKSGTALTKQHRAAYDANSADYLAGTRKFEFKQSIYGHASVKKALKTAQHRKCCFCEGRFTAHYHGDVEHYRPKRAVRQGKDADPLHPGYYWLVYSWRNLYYSCSICNSRKSSFFPLVDPAKRARSHADSLLDEKPLILDPSGPEDPRKHIKFRGDIAEGVTNAGRTTIEVVDLNRADLAEERLTRLNELRRLLEITQVLNGSRDPKATDLLKDAQCELDAAIEPTAEYSAMATDFLLAASNPERPQNPTG